MSDRVQREVHTRMIPPPASTPPPPPPNDTVVLCRLLLVTSAIGSICGKPLGHEGLCGDPIASTPKHPERCGLLVRETAGLYCGKLAGHRSPCDPVKHDWYPVECEHGFDACPKCGDGPLPPDAKISADVSAEPDQVERLTDLWVNAKADMTRRHELIDALAEKHHIQEQLDRHAEEFEQLRRERIVSVVFGHYEGAPKPFALWRRNQDRVPMAVGAEFPDGAVAIRLNYNGGWNTFSEGGAEEVAAASDLRVVWLSEELEPLAKMEQQRDSALKAVEAARGEGRAEQRSADITALRNAPRDPHQLEDWARQAASYLESLPSELVGGSVPPAQPDGLYGKFRVERVDGRDRPGGDRAEAKYFVLDYARDPYARAAVLAYADACDGAEPRLATDLRQAVQRTGDADPLSFDTFYGDSIQR